jgi:hypothetical protein
MTMNDNPSTSGSDEGSDVSGQPLPPADQVVDPAEHEEARESEEPFTNVDLSDKEEERSERLAAAEEANREKMADMGEDMTDEDGRERYAGGEIPRSDEADSKSDENDDDAA